MDALIAGLFVSVIPLLVGFLLVYYAVRLAIRHEREWERKRDRRDIDGSATLGRSP
jgi:hypothetical protein